MRHKLGTGVFHWDADEQSDNYQTITLWDELELTRFDSQFTYTTGELIANIDGLEMTLGEGMLMIGCEFYVPPTAEPVFDRGERLLNSNVRLIPAPGVAYTEEKIYRFCDIEALAECEGKVVSLYYETDGKRAI